MKRTYQLAVVGATGAVGRELIEILEQRQFPAGNITCFTSARSAGQTQQIGSSYFENKELNSHTIDSFDFVFMSAGSSTSKSFAASFADHGATVIDNSSAFRMDETVPLIVPEINSEKLVLGQKLFSNPNCTAILLTMVLHPIRKLGNVSRVIVSTYQSASGAGAQAMQELLDQTVGYLAGNEPEPRVLPHPYAFNLFSHNTPIDVNGQNEEEVKVTKETRRILAMPDLPINVTCVRVPVLRAHAESITIEFEGEAPSEEAIRAALDSAPGVRVVDDRSSNYFPMPRDASGGDDVLVGRIRRDLSHPSSVSLFLCGDQLRKGAALNAVQIAEALVEIRGQAQKLDSNSASVS